MATFNVAKARAAGKTDDDINQYLSSHPDIKPSEPISKQAAAQEPSVLDRVKGAIRYGLNAVAPSLDAANKAPINAIPNAIMGGVQTAMDKAGDAGSAAAQELGTPAPVANAAGAIVKAAPTLATMIDPIAAEPQAGRMASNFAARASGLGKVMQKTDRARAESYQAGKFAAENNLIPAFGSPIGMDKRVGAMQKTVGRDLGVMREGVGPQPTDSVVNALEDARTKITKGATGGVWDSVHRKIDEAIDTVLGLVGDKREQPATQAQRSYPITRDVQNPVSITDSRPSAASSSVSESRNPLTGEMIRTTAPTVTPGESRTYTAMVDSTETGRASTSYAQGGKKYSNVTGASEPAKKISLNRIVEAKTRLAKTINWFADNASQEDSKTIAVALEDGISRAMEQAGGDMPRYRALKSMYKSLKTLNKGLDNELSGVMGNSPLSARAMLMGVMSHGSSVPAELAKTVAFEGVRRRGAGITSNLAYGAQKAAAQVHPVAVPAQALERIMAIRNRNKPQ